MSTEPKRASFRNHIARLVGLLALLLAFLAALVTPGLPKIYAKSPPPLIASALLDHTVPAGEYLSAGFLLRNFPCVDQDNNNDCDYRDKFTSVIYRFDILSRNSGNQSRHLRRARVEQRPDIRASGFTTPPERSARFLCA